MKKNPSLVKAHKQLNIFHELNVYGWRIVHPTLFFRAVKTFWRSVKWSFQRVFWGIADPDWWEGNTYLWNALKIILINHRYKRIYTAPCSSTGEMTEEKWNETLDSMIKTIDEIIDFYTPKEELKLAIYSVEYKPHFATKENGEMTMAPMNEKIAEKINAIAVGAAKRKQENIKKVTDFLCEHIEDLWD